jgi:EpsD family peptidyl-prolyl cis-trans isomerase
MRVKASLITAALLLAGCGGSEGEGGGGGEPLAKGQTVATVNGKDVTVHQLNAELMGVNLPEGEQRKQVEQAALQAVIGRQILADIARERGIDKSPSFLMQQRRANENLLVQMLRSDIASRLPPATREDAEAYMRANPDFFAQRKVFQLDQIQFATPADMNKVKNLEPLKTMEQVEQQLIQDRIQYRRGATRLDTIGTNPELIRQMLRLPEGEIFVVPQQGSIVASRITGVQVVPFEGEDAINYAMNLVQNQRMQQATERELKGRLEEARKTIKYQEGFGPPAGAQPAAPTKAAAGT